MDTGIEFRVTVVVYLVGSYFRYFAKKKQQKKTTTAVYTLIQGTGIYSLARS